MTTKQITLSITGFLALVAFGYFSTQIIGATATSLIGFGGIGTGAVLEVKNHKSKQPKNNVTNL
ncbi:hypothetical protein [aff. Roholtiella sp. LEGE 12411]|uniref:hypothetical protein n=1 Tax=aff. Roholtiella sp. LEGE 12411 TaxID=1828822 RepID=UPI0018816C4C|nr:hypothetical protein [aff. Roholtiella sp. LEGE 12411]MBE9038870.1 hypothetical protein [aff. Roholtiella sp. LEGE 12411]